MSDVLSPGGFITRPPAAPDVALRSADVKREASVRRFAQYLGVIAVALCGCRGTSRPSAGLVVAEATAGGAAARAGIQPGDVLLSWEQRGRRGGFTDPFDVADVEAEEAPRGPIVLRGSRGTAPQAWTLTAGEWKLTPQATLEAGRWETLRGLLASA